MLVGEEFSGFAGALADFVGDEKDIILLEKVVDGAGIATFLFHCAVGRVRISLQRDGGISS